MHNQVRSYVRTALFVDFDNVYSNLNLLTRSLAKPLQRSLSGGYGGCKTIWGKSYRM